MNLRGWQRESVVVLVCLTALKVLVQLLLVNRYGYHGDELYFIECGRQLSFGYVDHPPLIPWLARLSDELGGGLLALRMPAILAGAGTLVFALLLVQEWGGQWRAQLLSLLAMLVAPAHLRMGAMLNIVVIEVFLCSVAAYLVARALKRGERWSWLCAGVALGVASLAKHSALLWVAALGVGLLASPSRRVLRTPWPWLALAIAVLMLAPNLVWQLDHDFATLEFLRELRPRIVERQGRLLFVAGQVLYFHPLALPIWMAGLALSFTARGQPMRPFAGLFVSLFAFLLLAGGKPYYLASAYPPVIAAGAIAAAGWLEQRRQAFRALVASLAVSGAALGAIALPALPIRQVDAVAEALLGWAVPPMALTHDMHGMHGWHEHAATIDRVFDRLPQAEQAQASVLAGTYAQASAVNVLAAAPTPRAVSGSMSYYLWGRDGERGAVLIAFGVPRALLQRHYARCTQADRIVAPLARPADSDLAVWLCRGSPAALAELWPHLRRFRHGPPAAPIATAHAP